MYEEYSNVRTLFSLCCSLFPVQLGKDKSGSHDDKLDSVGDLPTEQTLCAVCRCIMRAKATSLKLFTSRPCQSALCVHRRHLLSQMSPHEGLMCWNVDQGYARGITLVDSGDNGPNTVAHSMSR